MQKIYFIYIILLSIIYSNNIPKYSDPEFYNIISKRISTAKYYYKSYSLEEVKSSALIFDFGYRKPFLSNEYIDKFGILFHNYFAKIEFEGWDENISDWNNYSIGYGIGFKTFKRFQIILNAQYNFASGLWGEDSYPSINLGIGYTNYYKNKWLQYGVHYNKPFKRYITQSHSDYSYYDHNISSDEIGIEIDPLITMGGVVIVGAVAALAALIYAGEDPSDLYSPSSSSSSSKGCHVYGKVRFVEYGEDYKVRFVSYGENLKVKYEDYLADSPGEWKVVDYGEDYKIRIVSYGEDFKAREVSYSPGCN